MFYKYRAFLILFLLLLAAYNSSLAAEKSVDLNLTVSAKKWTGIRLRDINQGTIINTSIHIDGYVNIFLVDSHLYANFPKSKEKALFHASTKDNLNFSLRIPKSDSYVLIIDNHTGPKDLSFSVHIKASLNTKAIASPKKTITSSKNINQQLSKLSNTLKKAFIFNNIDIQINKCGKVNAYSHDNTVILCVELVQKLLQKVDDKKQVKKLLLFTLLHEMGHILMRQWDYPLYDNEEAADQFATVLLIMFNQSETAKVQANFFESIPPDLEYNQKIKKDILHPLSIQRARNIHRWINDPEIVKKWQSFFTPKMQTAFLKKLQKNPPSWVNLELLNTELKTRP